MFLPFFPLSSVDTTTFIKEFSISMSKIIFKATFKYTAGFEDLNALTIHFSLFSKSNIYLAFKLFINPYLYELSVKYFIFIILAIFKLNYVILSKFPWLKFQVFAVIPLWCKSKFNFISKCHKCSF